MIHNAWQLNRELREFAKLGLDIDSAAVLLDDDVMRHRQPKPRSFSRWLGGEERIEHLFAHVGRDTGTIVADTDFDGLASIPGGHAKVRLETLIIRFSLASYRGIEAIRDQI